MAFGIFLVVPCDVSQVRVNLHDRRTGLLNGRTSRLPPSSTLLHFVANQEDTEGKHNDNRGQHAHGYVELTHTWGHFISDKNWDVDGSVELDELLMVAVNRS